MPLRGVKPEAIEKRLKLFEFGETGSGKTLTGLQFPRVYMIDTERGAENDQYRRALDKGDGLYFPTDDLDEIITEVTSLLTERHEFRTLFIDPITIPYAIALDREAGRLAKEKGAGDGMEFGRHKIGPDRKMKRLLSLIFQLDMNVVLTAHGKTRWRKGPKGEPEEAGTTFDAYAKLDYAVDLMLETQLRGPERWAVVRKSRIEAFRMLDAFPLSYEAIAQRYGHDILERRAVPVLLATPEQVARLELLVGLVKLKDGTVEKWLDKADVESFAEMPMEIILKCIAYVENLIQTASGGASEEQTGQRPTA